MGELNYPDDVNGPATGAELIEWLRSPPSVERRAESVLTMARAIGIDNAKRVTDRLRTKELAIYALFENDLISPMARLFLDQFLGHWMAGIEDWGMLTAGYAESIGMTIEQLAERDSLHRQRLRKFTDPADTDSIPPQNRFGAHLLDMEDLGGLDGNNEITNTYFQYDRFRIAADEGDEEE